MNVQSISEEVSKVVSFLYDIILASVQSGQLTAYSEF